MTLDPVDVSPDRRRPPPFDLSRLLESIPAPALLIDGEHRIVGANAGFRSRLPARSRCVGLACHALEHGKEKPCADRSARCPLDECSSGAQPARQVHRHSGREGAFWEEVVSSPVGAGSWGSRLVLQLFRALDQPPIEPPGLLVGDSPAMQALRRAIVRLSAREGPILVRGEPGTERELVARALHAAGPRRDGPFVVLFCAGGLPVSLGASSPVGEDSLWSGPRFRQAARNGTLFLDDLTELSSDCQEELFLNLTGIRRAAIARPWSELAGARWIFGASRSPSRAEASHRLLPELVPLVEEAEIVVPPLRERAGDLPQLVSALRPWLVAPPELEIADGVAAALAPLPLFGNLPELRQRLQEAVLNAGPGPLAAEHLVWVD